MSDNYPGTYNGPMGGTPCSYPSEEQQEKNQEDFNRWRDNTKTRDDDQDYQPW